MKLCEYEICNKRSYARNMCKYHYGQHYRGKSLTDQADLRLKRRRVLGSMEPYKP